MPFNRVNNVKALSFWLLVLNATAEEDKEENEGENKNKSTSDQQDQKLSTDNKGDRTSTSSNIVDSQGKEKVIQTKHSKLVANNFWVPGMLIVPFPEAGWFLGNVDVGYWASFLYVLGSLTYVIDSFFLWPRVNPDYTDDGGNPAAIFNFISVWIFVVNALVCFLDWHLQVKQLSVMNMNIDNNITGGFEIQDIPVNITWYYFFNNIFFLGAAVVFFIQGIWMEDNRTDLLHCSDGFCGAFWINFWGNFLYLASSAFAVLEFFEDRKMRQLQNAPPVYFFTWDYETLDWFGWGDWLYLLTSITAFGQSFFMFNGSITDDDNSAYYLFYNVLFLLDSLAYYIGYLVFLLSLREALRTGMIPAAQTAIINEMIGDNFDDTPSNETVPRDTTFGTLERQSLLPIDNSGRVSIQDIRWKLQQAKHIRIRKTEVMRLRASEQQEISNPIRATLAETKDIELGRTKSRSRKFSHEWM